MARRRLPVILLAIVALGVVAASVTTSVMRSQSERDVRAFLDEVGAPAGFRRTGVSSTGSVFCFGPCLRVHARYVVDAPFDEAVARVVAYMRTRGATKSCRFTTNCDAPLVPEDCRVLDDGPECLVTPVVGGRPVFVAVARSGAPTEVTLTAGPVKDRNLFF